jgi:hypothetical protein
VSFVDHNPGATAPRNAPVEGEKFVLWKSQAASCPFVSFVDHNPGATAPRNAPVEGEKVDGRL